MKIMVCVSHISDILAIERNIRKTNLSINGLHLKVIMKQVVVDG
jgi:hypothetical protein